jgi:hypothetical protein
LLLSHQSVAQQASSKAASAVPAQSVRTTALPGTEATLRRLLAEVASGRPNYNLLAPAMAAELRDKLPAYQQDLRALGELESVTFASAMPDGADVFDVKLANGVLKCLVRLDAQGKLVAGECRQSPPP